MNEIYRHFKIMAGDRWDLWAKRFEKEGVDESYFPLWLKKQAGLKVFETYWAELADFDWSLNWVRSQTDLKPTVGNALMVNPLSRIHKFEFDIQGWILSGSDKPQKDPHILIVSPVKILRADREMALIIDELSEHPQSEDSLLQLLSEKESKNQLTQSLNALTRLGIVISGNT